MAIDTSIYLLLCCHRFENTPFGIPVNLQIIILMWLDEHLVECASSYNFKMHDNIDEMWERYNLINLLYRRLEFR
jgi:hypothetical protein